MPASYFFLISPNNSGTTIISQYLAGQIDGYLPPFGHFEGQMAPGVKAHMRDRPWDPERRFDWPMIRREWDRLLAASGKAVFVEASPPNMMRLDAIRETFGAQARFVLSISNPYLFLTSTIYNYRRPPMSQAMLESAVQAWLMRAERMRRNREAHPDLPLRNYEDFCADPAGLNRMLKLPLRARAPLPGKSNSRLGEIADQTLKNASFLGEREINAINTLLIGHSRLLDGFGYSLRPGEALLEEARASGAHAAGRARRASWEAADRGLARHLARLRARAGGFFGR